MRLVLSPILFTVLIRDVMAGAVAAVLQSWGKGQEAHNDSIAILEPLNHGQQLPTSHVRKNKALFV